MIIELKITNARHELVGDWNPRYHLEAGSPALVHAYMSDIYGLVIL